MPTASKAAIPIVAANPWRQVAMGTALAAGGFCLVVCLVLVINHFHSLAVDPLHSPELVKLKADLARNPQSEAIKQQVRALDLRLRQAQAQQDALGAQGAWLLLGGAAIFLISIKFATYRKKLPRPEKRNRSRSEAARAKALARGAIALLAVLIAGTSWIAARQAQTALSDRPAKPVVPKTPAPEPAAPVSPFPSAEEMQRNWPRFRGPDGLGISVYTNAPLQWNGQTGEGILWKTAVPIAGPNSPVVWGNRIFLSGANKSRREVYCFEAESGKLLWQKPVENVPSTNSEPPTVMEDSGGYAASTVASDGRRVYAIFANGDIAAFDFKGERVWALNLGLPDNSYGHATSLVLFQDRLLVLFDQGTGKDGKSKLLALDTLTGKTVWQSPARPVPNSWATPIVINAGKRDQVITCGNPWVIAYDPANGTELWRAKALYGEVTPSPIYANGFVFTAIEGEKLSAIRPDGSGDVTKTHIAWFAEDGLPDICSPLSDGQRVYLLGTYGLLTCYDAQAGKKLWDKELELGFHSSPSLAGDRIYLFSDKGVCVVVQAGPEFKELARSELGEEVLSSPAFADGRIYIRGKKTLFCLGNK